VGHLAEFISAFGDVDVFNIQGLEKLNDLTTQQYFRGTNKQFIAMQTLVSRRLRNEINRSNETLVIKKRNRGKNLTTLINIDENSKQWIQFKINDIILFTNEIKNMCKKNFSAKVI